MRRFHLFAFSTAVFAMTASVRAEAPLPTVLQVLGNVTNAAKPVGNALVIALNLNSLDAIQTFSSIDGTFVLPPLPAAVYKIIAVKAGFLPAMAMVVPTKKDQRVALRLDTEKRAHGKDANQEIWELRGSLPADVLRELDNVLEAPKLVAAQLGPQLQAPRFRGEMMSLTGVTAASTPAVSQTALGMESRLGDSWQIGFRGNLHRIDDPTEDRNLGATLAQSSVAQIEVRSSPTNAYRLASTSSSWRYASAPAAGEAPSADIRAHNFEWEHGDARVQVRYLAQQNLFVATPGSELVEIAGNTTVMQTAHSDLGVFVRVAQESVRNAANDIVRTADVTANASLEIVPSLVVHYGVASRMALAGTALSPRSGAELKLGKDLSFIVTGQYKMVDGARRTIALPSLVVWSDESRVLPRYSYSFGFVSGDEKRDRISAIATITAIDAPIRLVFTDGFEQFWDGLYVDAGDLRRDLRVTWRKQLANRVAIDLETSAGSASRERGSPLPIADKTYFTGDVASTYTPTGTTLAVSYRHMRQPQLVGAEYSSDRMNVHFTQALHLPLDLKLLLGYEVAHAQNSPFLLDTVDAAGSARRYVGGRGRPWTAAPGRIPATPRPRCAGGEPEGAGHAGASARDRCRAPSPAGCA